MPGLVLFGLGIKSLGLELGFGVIMVRLGLELGLGFEVIKVRLW